MKTIRKWLGDVVVDSGTVWIVDPCHDDAVDIAEYAGVVVDRFGGDGVYGVYGYYTTYGLLMKVVIDFQLDVSEEYDDYAE